MAVKVYFLFGTHIIVTVSKTYMNEVHDILFVFGPMTKPKCKYNVQVQVNINYKLLRE